jgi:hypothetical protein
VASSEYWPQFTEQFTAIVNSAKKGDKALAKQIKAGVAKILSAPLLYTHSLSGNHQGKYTKHIGLRDGYRIIYTPCALCRSKGHQTYNNCAFCGETNDKCVVFFFAFKKTGRRSDYDL